MRGEWIDLELINGWRAVDWGFPPQYRQTANGGVEFRGRCEGGEPDTPQALLPHGLLEPQVITEFEVLLHDERKPRTRRIVIGEYTLQIGQEEEIA